LLTYLKKLVRIDLPEAHQVPFVEPDFTQVLSEVMVSLQNFQKTYFFISEDICHILKVPFIQKVLNKLYFPELEF
jgi:hypothetical protein